MQLAGLLIKLLECSRGDKDYGVRLAYSGSIAEVHAKAQVTLRATGTMVVNAGRYCFAT